MALYHLLNNLEIPEGCEVLISGIHVADFVNIVRMAGMRPVVVDLESGGFGLDLEDMKRKVTAKSRVLILTHLSGYVTDMVAVMKVADKQGLTVIEDCSQAFTSRQGGRLMGTFGRAAIFSLSLLKSVCALNGGMVVTKDRALLAGLRQSANSALPPARMDLASEAMKNLILKTALHPAVFTATVSPLLWLLAKHGDIFSKYQKTNKTVELRQSLPRKFMTDFAPAQAWLGMHCMRNMEEREALRRKWGLMLYDLLEDGGPGFSLPRCIPDSENGFWLFPVLADNPKQLKFKLLRYGIDSSLMLLSVLSREPCFKHLEFQAPQAEKTHDAVLFVPMYPELGEDGVLRIAWALQSHGVG